MNDTITQPVVTNGRAIERGILIVGFMIQIGALIFTYGKTSQQVQDLDNRVRRIEQYLDDQRADDLRWGEKTHEHR